MESVANRRFEPGMEELTGPVALGSVGVLLWRLPSMGFGPISDTRTLGLVAVVGAVTGAVALIVRHMQQISQPVPVTPILPAPREGELGPIPGLVVDQIGVEPAAHVVTAGRPRDLPRAA
ncbi:MAG: hypothetical protein KJN63_01435 [Acidimicrobiia bacterium]|nr:hypothetical protein [Acidimicrobiia bacterium]